MIIDKHINKDNWDEIKDILPQITEIHTLDLYNMVLTEFPKMSHITIKGDFLCMNNKITSFKDCPYIGGNLYSDFDIFDKIQKYSKEKKISLLESQVELYNQQDEELLEHIDKFPDLVACIRMKELNKLLCA